MTVVEVGVMIVAVPVPEEPEEPEDDVVEATVVEVSLKSTETVWVAAEARGMSRRRRRRRGVRILLHILKSYDTCAGEGAYEGSLGNKEVCGDG